jgi:hypothetical protein
MKILNWHVPGTRDLDEEIEKLAEKLRDREVVLQQLREQDALRVGQVRYQASRAERFQKENQDLRQEVEAHRAAFNALAPGRDLSPERMLELARQATKIERAANASCSLSYELFAVQVCDEADRILPTLNEKEGGFFLGLLGDNYTPPHERGQDWQSEHEIRQELCREMYGDPSDL